MSLINRPAVDGAVLHAASSLTVVTVTVTVTVMVLVIVVDFGLTSDKAL